MRTTVEILASYRNCIKQRFFEVVGRKADVPSTLAVPSDPQEALRLGMALGRQEGYGDGLVDGTKLGLDLGLEAVDAMLSQSVILGQLGMD